MSDNLVDMLKSRLAGMSPEQKAALDKELSEELSKPWLPQPGPQTEAYYCKADLLLYGGAAGGGKSDLLAGLAVTGHERSVIFRAQIKDAGGIEDRLAAMVGEDNWSRGDHLHRSSGRLIEIGALGTPGSEKGWQGRAHDLIGFDEGAQLDAFRVNFVLGWNRSATGRRCRAVIASNPPLAGDGEWLLEWFAPWIDPLYPKPAKPGELRWAVTVGTGDQIRTLWPSDAEMEINDKGKRFITINGEPYEALTRTFIPSKLSDNTYLAEDGAYRAKVNSMPEPMRSALLYGDFSASRKDHEWQVIPTGWIKAAVERWIKANGVTKAKMLAVGADIAQGGDDFTTFAPLHEDNFYGELKTLPGTETPDGPTTGVQLLGIRRNGAVPVIDMGGGYGGSTRDYLRVQHEIPTIDFVPAEGSPERTKDGGFGFLNTRAEAWWMFREALDPNGGVDPPIALPPNTRLQAQLGTPRFEVRSGKTARIQVEEKAEIRKRLGGGSTDDADAVIQAWWGRRRAAKLRIDRVRRTHQRQPLADPFRELRDPLDEFQ